MHFPGGNKATAPPLHQQQLQQQWSAALLRRRAVQPRQQQCPGTRLAANSAIAPSSSELSPAPSAMAYELENSSEEDSEEYSETTYTPSNVPVFLSMPFGPTAGGNASLLWGMSPASSSCAEVLSSQGTEIVVGSNTLSPYRILRQISICDTHSNKDGIPQMPAIVSERKSSMQGEENQELWSSKLTSKNLTNTAIPTQLPQIVGSGARIPHTQKPTVNLAPPHDENTSSRVATLLPTPGKICTQPSRECASRTTDKTSTPEAPANSCRGARSAAGGTGVSNVSRDLRTPLDDDAKRWVKALREEVEGEATPRLILNGEPPAHLSEETPVVTVVPAVEKVVTSRGNSATNLHEIPASVIATTESMASQGVCANATNELTQLTRQAMTAETRRVKPKEVPCESERRKFVSGSDASNKPSSLFSCSNSFLPRVEKTQKFSADPLQKPPQQNQQQILEMAIVSLRLGGRGPLAQERIQRQRIRRWETTERVAILNEIMEMKQSPNIPHAFRSEDVVSCVPSPPQLSSQLKGCEVNESDDVTEKALRNVNPVEEWGFQRTATPQGLGTGSASAKATDGLTRQFPESTKKAVKGLCSPRFPRMKSTRRRVQTQQVDILPSIGGSLFKLIESSQVLTENEGNMA
ncbi:hypothetical protein MOQ_008967 [Trypanosoma cruzi marinkellei]|uniref:Uncharacterized protein n=1 Tax=Trypanosoma cruzi marinkellei TaxID=85056 RepID=K2MNU8_TRYCR|nr:hypothetical protein MOQ_008967 [Trypanosoma cruzi marinkellei]